jgi:hypothetical protein
MFFISPIQKIITDFAYGSKIKFSELYTDFDFIDDVQNSIPRIMLAAVTFSEITQDWCPNPFIEGFPYYPTKLMYKDTIFSQFITYIPEFLNNAYYANRYKGCIVKKTYALKKNGFDVFNKIFFSFFTKLKITDFNKKHQHLYKEFKQLTPLNRSLG